MMNKLFFLPLALLILSSSVLAAPFDVSSADEDTFDQILEPVVKIYGLVKYAASLIALLFMVFAGITYMSAGSDTKKRDTAKHTAAYVVIGLCVIWAAPFMVDYLVG